MIIIIYNTIIDLSHLISSHLSSHISFVFFIVSLRNRIAVVPQDTSLFDNTIEYNIKYGIDDDDEYNNSSSSSSSSSSSNNNNNKNLTVVSQDKFDDVIKKCNLGITIYIRMYPFFSVCFIIHSFFH